MVPESRRYDGTSRVRVGLGMDGPLPSHSLKRKERKVTMKFLNSGQGLIEASLVMAFIAMASASLFLGASGGITGGSGIQGSAEHHEQSVGCR
jgi:hypothetical protein